jgi:hypothetical protein
LANLNETLELVDLGQLNIDGQHRAPASGI